MLPKLVPGESVGCDNFFVFFVPNDPRDLWSSVDRVDAVSYGKDSKIRSHHFHLTCKNCPCFVRGAKVDEKKKTIGFSKCPFPDEQVCENLRKLTRPLQNMFYVMSDKNIPNKNIASKYNLFSTKAAAFSASKSSEV